MVVRHGDVLIHEAKASWCCELLYLEHDVNGVQEQSASLSVVEKSWHGGAATHMMVAWASRSALCTKDAMV